MEHRTELTPEQRDGFKRPQLMIADMKKLMHEIIDRIPPHFAKYDPGVFLHPHEIVGCMFGQQLKLSASADASIYTGDLAEFRERCMKTVMAILVGTASVDRLVELRTNGKLVDGVKHRYDSQQRATELAKEIASGKFNGMAPEYVASAISSHFE
jgi:hypothetical protein